MTTRCGKRSRKTPSSSSSGKRSSSTVDIRTFITVIPSNTSAHDADVRGDVDGDFGLADNIPSPKTSKTSDRLRFLALIQDDTWRTKLEPELSKPYCVALEERVEKEYANHTVYPPAELIFNAFNLTRFDTIRVVIIGQDPYHGPGQAHGLAFSVPRGEPIPPSLRNVYKELVENVPGFEAPRHGCLEGWAKQGVLMLNSTLTVRARAANSHEKLGWQRFTDRVIRLLSDSAPSPLVFLLWGRYAQRKADGVDRRRHRIVSAAHPSPLSARHFLGCRCFVAVDAALAELGREPIRWQLC